MNADRPVIAQVLHRLDRAGAEVLAAGLARSMRDRFESVFLCLDGLGPLADELRGEGFAVESLDRRPGIDRQLARTLRQQLAKHHAALVHAHQYTPFFYSALARGLWPTQQTPPILFTEHGRHYPDHRSTKRILANKLLLRKRDRVTAVGQFVCDALIRNEGIRAKRIAVLYNGITPGPEVAAADRAAARAQLGIDNARPVAMQVARFHTVKDHATAIRAWAKVHQALPGALLILIGDGDERNAIEAQVKALSLTDAVRFTGAINNARQLIPAADVCMLTSLSEGVSVTLLEAMAAGKPVVATNVGGNGEVVDHHQTGLLAPRGDDQGLADHLLALLTEPDRAATMGRAGYQRLSQQFTADRMHNAYTELYERMLNR